MNSFSVDFFWPYLHCCFVYVVIPILIYTFLISYSYNIFVHSMEVAKGVVRTVPFVSLMCT